LFLRKTNEHIAIWEGHKYTKEEGKTASGIENIVWNDSFESTLHVLLTYAQTIYLNQNDHDRAVPGVDSRELRFAKELKSNYPLHNYERSAPIMHALRAIKSPLEIASMQTACNITEKAFRRVLGFVKPGVWEYEIEAEFAHEFLRKRSKGFAYTPIIAAGKNACVLHYIENNQECASGDVILLDVGAEYANYSSDMTRCIPVNGRFTDRQRAVYNAVLHVKREAEKLLVPGTVMAEYHKEVGHLMEAQLVQLGLIDKTDIQNQRPEWPAYKKYFMHGTSHFLGLDTHDVGLWNEPIKAGMVFTCEPGIYIPEEGLGIRIEDDLVVQDSGAPFNLMRNIPIEADEIEALMNA
jgi:Xaa-Pro aminopeptidase